MFPELLADLALIPNDVVRYVNKEVCDVEMLVVLKSIRDLFCYYFPSWKFERKKILVQVA